MNDLKKKPKLTKIERRAKALRDNLKKRKQQQAKREAVKPEPIVLNEPLDSNDPSENLEKIQVQNPGIQTPVEGIDVVVEIEFPSKKVAKSPKTIDIKKLK